MKLAYELLCLVVAHLTPKDLAQLCLVCRPWRQRMQPFLYRVVHLDTQWQLDMFIKTVNRRRKLGVLVQRVYLYHPDLDLLDKKARKLLLLRRATPYLLSLDHAPFPRGPVRPIEFLPDENSVVVKDGDDEVAMDEKALLPAQWRRLDHLPRWHADEPSRWVPLLHEQLRSLECPVNELFDHALMPEGRLRAHPIEPIFTHLSTLTVTCYERLRASSNTPSLEFDTLVALFESIHDFAPNLTSFTYRQPMDSRDDKGAHIRKPTQPPQANPFMLPPIDPDYTYNSDKMVPSSKMKHVHLTLMWLRQPWLDYVHAKYPQLTSLSLRIVRRIDGIDTHDPFDRIFSRNPQTQPTDPLRIHACNLTDLSINVNANILERMPDETSVEPLLAQWLSCPIMDQEDAAADEQDADYHDDDDDDDDPDHDPMSMSDEDSYDSDLDNDYDDSADDNGSIDPANIIRVPGFDSSDDQEEPHPPLVEDHPERMVTDSASAARDEDNEDDNGSETSMTAATEKDDASILELKAEEHTEFKPEQISTSTSTSNNNNDNTDDQHAMEEENDDTEMATADYPLPPPLASASPVPSSPSYVPSALLASTVQPSFPRPGPFNGSLLALPPPPEPARHKHKLKSLTWRVEPCVFHYPAVAYVPMDLLHQLSELRAALNRFDTPMHDFFFAKHLHSIHPHITRLELNLVHRTSDPAVDWRHMLRRFPSLRHLSLDGFQLCHEDTTRGEPKHAKKARYALDRHQHLVTLQLNHVQLASGALIGDIIEACPKLVNLHVHNAELSLYGNSRLPVLLDFPTRAFNQVSFYWPKMRAPRITSSLTKLICVQSTEKVTERITAAQLLQDYDSQRPRALYSDNVEFAAYLALHPCFKIVLRAKMVYRHCENTPLEHGHIGISDALNDANFSH
ncbi:hypothetical protein BC940DRAFT_294234 [Gongronella butleri]|nr:hypothetical protein BC940DRAFT_294234 [Gongronella butleri]